MRKIHHRPPVRHGLFDLPLFAWIAAHDAPQLTDGGRWVRRHTGVPPTLANRIAELAGIGPERNR